MGIKELAKQLVGKKKKPAAPPAHLTDKHAKKATLRGKETANSVYEMDYKKGSGMDKGFFKPDQPMAPAKNAVAANAYADKLGMSDIVPETKYATHKVKDADGNKSTQTGAVSAAVEGKAFSTNKFKKVGDSYKEFTRTVEEFELMMTGYEIRKDGTVWTGDDPEFNNEIDFEKDTTQGSLNRLQWFDGIIGNLDRHAGNLIHDPTTGLVHGIDNDLSFGEGRAVGDNEIDSQQKFLGWPEQVDQDTATKILLLKDTDVQAMLASAGPAGAMDPRAIADAKLRLKEAQDKVTALVLADKIVGKWDQATFAEAANQGDGKVPRNYLQRQMMALQKTAPKSMSNPSLGAPKMPAKPLVPVQQVQQQPALIPMPQLPNVPQGAQGAQPQGNQARPTGGLRRPNYGALRNGAVPGLPAPNGPQGRPTNGAPRNPRYNALRRGQVQGGEQEGFEEELEDVVKRPRLRPTGRNLNQ